jgi:ubiquinone/menaquinone biosynthesis C-methylase UbiE
VSARAFRDLREFKSWNDAMVEKYDVEQFHNHPSFLVRYVERKRIRRIFALLAPRPGDRVLEIGCGAGHLLVQVPSVHGFGIDLAESLLAKAARRLTKRGTLVQGDAEHLPFRNRAWDRVYCSEVLEHLPSPAAALGEMRRIVASEGVAVVSVPNERLINALKALLRKSGLYRVLLSARAGDYQMPERMDDEWHLHVFDLAGLLALIPPGLRVTHIEGVPFRWLPLRYVVRCESDDQERANRG